MGHTPVKLANVYVGSSGPAALVAVDSGRMLSIDDFNTDAAVLRPPNITGSRFVSPSCALGAAGPATLEIVLATFKMLSELWISQLPASATLSRIESKIPILR